MIETLANYPDVNIIECDDVTSVLPSLVSSGNVLLVTSKGFVKRGTVSHLVEALGASRVMVFDEVTPNAGVMAELLGTGALTLAPQPAYELSPQYVQRDIGWKKIAEQVRRG